MSQQRGFRKILTTPFLIERMILEGCGAFVPVHQAPRDLKIVDMRMGYVLGNPRIETIVSSSDFTLDAEVYAASDPSTMWMAPDWLLTFRNAN